MQLEKKNSFEKSNLEKSKSLIESQRQVLALEVDNLNKEIKLYTEEIAKINDIRSKELKEKNAEISELKRLFTEKADELNLIENKIQTINIDSSKITSPNEQSGPRSIWNHVDLLSKQLEEKNYM